MLGNSADQLSPTSWLERFPGSKSLGLLSFCLRLCLRMLLGRGPSQLRYSSMRVAYSLPDGLRWGSLRRQRESPI